jgi:pimeloyl-ACP methyl ester carboxylesterase
MTVQRTNAFGARIYACGVTTLLSLCSFAPLAAAETPSVIDNPAYTRAQQLVEVAPGRRLNLYCVGSGSPTVIFEAGLGIEAGTWGLVQPAVAAHTRACSYERAGLGFSDPADRPGTAANAVDDLHHLLAAAGIKPPYVLVGHSYGGMIVRLYADLYPKDVVGMVLVDTAKEDWPMAFWKIDPEQHDWKTLWNDAFSEHSKSVQAEQQCVDAARAKTLKAGSALFDQCVPPPFPKYGKAMGDAYGKLHVMPAFQAASMSEDANLFTASADQVRAARRWYGDMPLIVLTPAYPAVMPKNVPPDETQAHWTAETHAQLAMDDQMAALSKKGEARQVENTMHYIQLQQPEAVTKAVMDVLQQAAPQAQRAISAVP